jgi:hypothetical protein
MHRPTLITTLLAASALAAGAASAAAAPGDLAASFDYAPSAPQPREAIALRSTSTSASTAGIRVAWDLDADGAFDDGADPTATVVFDSAGDHVVRMIARQLGRADSVAERTIHVAVPPVDPPPSDPPPVDPPPSDPPPVDPPPSDPPPPGAANQPPVATIDDTCMKLSRRTPTVCTAPLTRVGRPKTFTAARSSDPDGQVVRWEWDLDGDGTFKTDGGGSPQTTVTYRDMGAVTIGLRVTDDDGATATTSLRLKKLASDCTTSFLQGDVRATSPCFTVEQRDGGATVEYRSRHPVELNGIAVVPAPGRTVLIRSRRAPLFAPGGRRIAGFTRTFQLFTVDGEASIQVEHQRVVLDDGPVVWGFANGRFTGVRLPAVQKLNGLPISGMTDGIPVPGVGLAEPGFWVQLPEQLGAPTSAEPVPLRVRMSRGLLPTGMAQLGGGAGAGSGSGSGSGSGDGADAAVASGGPLAGAAAGGPLRFEVPSAAIGPFGMRRLIVTWDGVDLWEIEASVAIPPPLAAELDADAAIEGGALRQAGVDAKFPQGLGPIGPVYLTRIAFRIEIRPTRARCFPDGETVDYGTPSFALCGEVGLSAGPKVGAARAIGLDGGLAFATYDGQPSVMRAFGSVQLVTIPLAEASVEVHTDGYVKLSGDYQWGYPGWVNLSGGLGLELMGSKFNATGRVRACLQFVDLCEGAKGLISNKGIVACMNIDLWVDDWHPGAGYRWSGDFTPYFAGCDVGPYRERIKRGASASAASAAAARAGGPRARAAAEQEATVELPAGLPGTVFAAEGVDGAPVLEISGPHGERIVTPRETRADVSRDHLSLPNPQAKLTQVAIPSPSAGRWTIRAAAGSTPLTSIRTAEGLPAPEVKATVAGRGHARALRWSVTERPEQTVRFVERGSSAGGAIGVARGARGTLRFAPAEGRAERREIVAIVEQDGQLRDELVVASYRAPAAARPAAVRGLRAVRRGTTLRLRWRAQPGAARYRTAVALGSGRRVVLLGRGTSAVVRDVPRGMRAQVAVRALSASGIAGRDARLRVAAVRRAGR